MTEINLIVVAVVSLFGCLISGTNKNWGVFNLSLIFFAMSMFGLAIRIIG